MPDRKIHPALADLKKNGATKVKVAVSDIDGVLRGKYILQNIFDDAPPPPPADVPPLDEEAVGKSASLRQQMEVHRADPACASCHNKMDPLGFGLENYDAIGKWRTKDGKFPVDSSGTLPNGSCRLSPSRRAGRKFIDGEPMKPATNRFRGSS